MYIFLSKVHLEKEQDSKNYLRIAPGSFDELFVLVRDDITKYITNMGDASTPKVKLAAKVSHVHSFVKLFFLCGDLKF